MVPPGSYTVRLTSGTWTNEAAAHQARPARRAGRRDDRGPAELDHNLSVREIVSDMNRFTAEVEQAYRAATGEKKARIGEVRDQINSEPWRYGRPGLAAHVQYLYGAMMRADQVVGNDAKQRLVQLRKELQEAQAKFARANLMM